VSEQHRYAQKMPCRMLLLPICPATKQGCMDYPMCHPPHRIQKPRIARQIPVPDSCRTWQTQPHSHMQASYCLTAPSNRTVACHAAHPQSTYMITLPHTCCLLLAPAQSACQLHNTVMRNRKSHGHPCHDAQPVGGLPLPHTEPTAVIKVVCTAWVAAQLTQGCMSCTAFC
jgi:hypothetical protein